MILARGSLCFTALTALVLLPVLSCQLSCERQTSTPSNAGPSASTPTANMELLPLTNMVLIKAGTFTRIRTPVMISHDFWLGRYEVTQAEYAAVMGQNPSHFKGDSNRPVEKISFFDAMSYCARLSSREKAARHLPPTHEYRLPSEAEWEYACRAGTTNKFSFSDDARDADPYAWTAENSEATTHPVGQKRPNPWGLHDMHGNVWEWCLDWFGQYPTVPLVDPAGPASGKFKVFRGGSWNHEMEFTRSANRFTMSPSNGIYFVGFRVVLSPIRQQPGP